MKKLTQYKIKTKQNIKASDILEHYKVIESDLYLVYEAIVCLCYNNGINIVLVNLENIEEFNGEEYSDHAETCTTDGRTIYLHNNLNDHGGVLTRVYDVLHMGCGHLLQRGSTEKSGLDWYGDNAWRIGSVFHINADQKLLNKVSAYELEAGLLGLYHLQEVLKKICKKLKSKPDSIMQLYSDYVRTDREYIINYYKTGVSTNFFQSRKYDHPLLTPKKIIDKAILKIEKRSQIEIGLIRNDLGS